MGSAASRAKGHEAGNYPFTYRLAKFLKREEVELVNYSLKGSTKSGKIEEFDAKGIFNRPTLFRGRQDRRRLSIRRADVTAESTYTNEMYAAMGGGRAEAIVSSYTWTFSEWEARDDYVEEAMVAHLVRWAFNNGAAAVYISDPVACIKPGLFADSDGRNVFAAQDNVDQTPSLQLGGTEMYEFGRLIRGTLKTGPKIKLVASDMEKLEPFLLRTDTGEIAEFTKV